MSSALFTLSTVARVSAWADPFHAVHSVQVARWMSAASVSMAVASPSMAAEITSRYLVQSTAW